MSAGRSAQGQILIHIDERRRDLVVSLALQRLFEESGVGVTLSTRRTTSPLLKEIPFDAVIVPSMDHIPRDRFKEICDRSKIYMLPTEGAIFGEKPLLLKYGGGYQPEEWDLKIPGAQGFFLWGENSRRTLEATGRFLPDQLRVVGAPRMDFFLVKPSTEERKRFEPDSVGTISNFILTNSYNRFSIFETAYRGRNRHGFYHAPTRELEDRFWQEVAWVRICIQLFDQYKQRGEQIRLRIHPREDFEAYRYLQEKYSSTVRFEGQEQPFEIWLENLGVFLGCNSTTFFEVVAANKPSLNLEGLMHRLAEHVDGFEQNRYPIMDHIESPTTLDALFGRIEQLRSKPPQGDLYSRETTEILRDVCNFPRPVSTLAMVVREIMSELEPRGVNAQWGRVRAKATEWLTFSVRRDRITSCWYPMNEPAARREHAIPIARYLQAARSFPAGVTSPRQDRIPVEAAS